MSVKQHTGAGNAVGFADHDRMTLGRADVSLKTDRFEVARDMLGGVAALLFEGRIGRYRRNAEQREQPLDALIDILVDAAQHRVECAHDGLLIGLKSTLATTPRHEKPGSRTAGGPSGEESGISRLAL